MYTSVRIHHRGASLSKQQTDCHCTKQDLSRYRLLGITYANSQDSYILSVWLHMHGLSFTLKSWAKFLVFVSVIYALTWSDLIHHCDRNLYWLWAACCWWSVAAWSKLPCMRFNASRLCSGSPMLNSGNNLHLPSTCTELKLHNVNI